MVSKLPISPRSSELCDHNSDFSDTSNHASLWGRKRKDEKKGIKSIDMIYQSCNMAHFPSGLICIYQKNKPTRGAPLSLTLYVRIFFRPMLCSY